MDRFGHSATSLDELKQIQDEVRSCNSQKVLRSYFERVQELRRIHSGDFDIQLMVAEAQENIIARTREIRSRAGVLESEGDLFKEPANAGPPAELRDEESNSDRENSRPEAGEGNRKSWRRATYMALGLTAIICVAFFYLIQTARRINLAPPVPTPPKTAETEKVPVQNAKATEAAIPAASSVRLYTDLIPGTVSVDDGEPQDLKDGELNLDHLEAGRHSIKVAGRSGTAAFSFDVTDGSAPQAVAPVTATNAMAVLVSAQDGKGRLLTNVLQPEIALDGKPLGQAGPDGLALDNLGSADHELQVAQGSDKQRFVMTYTPAPVLTVYVKSDLYAGVVTVITKQDGASIFIDDKPYRRKTDKGQIRIPLKVGEYVIHVHKDGFIDPPPQNVEIKKAEEAELTFNMEPVPNLASLEVRGAAPGTAVYVDKEQAATVGAGGSAKISSVKSGEHTIELRLAGSIPKRFQRNFQAGEIVSLAGSDVALEKTVVERAVEQPAVAASAPSSVPTASISIPGEQVRRGGGFVHYNVPRAAGHYSFQAHGKIGGFLKHGKLQWYAGYENSENYIMFAVDGKHATVREMSGGKATEISRVPFNTSSDGWIQVDMSVKPGSITARVKTPDTGWSDLGAVTSDGRDFTQDRVGFYVPGNDEVAIADFRFSSR